MEDMHPFASEQDAEWMTKPVWTWWQREKIAILGIKPRHPGLGQSVSQTVATCLFDVKFKCF